MSLLLRYTVYLALYIFVLTQINLLGETNFSGETPQRLLECGFATLQSKSIACVQTASDKENKAKLFLLSFSKTEKEEKTEKIEKAKKITFYGSFYVPIFVLFEKLSNHVPIFCTTVKSLYAYFSVYKSCPLYLFFQVWRI